VKPLTDRDMETLGELIAGYDNLAKFGRDGVAPLDFGGGNGSHHGATATKLAKRGLADHRQRGAPWGDTRTTGARGSKVYKPTEAGRKAFEEWWEARKAARNS
jgi:hypothetical protein